MLAHISCRIEVFMMKSIRASSFVLATACWILFGIAQAWMSMPAVFAAEKKAESWFKAVKVAEGVWCISDNGSDNIYLVEGKKKALLIDTGLGAARLSEFVRTITKKPLMVVNTHGHPDHAGGNYQFRTIYAHPADFGSIRQSETKESRAQSLANMAQGKTASDTVPLDEAIKAKEEELLPVKGGFAFELGGRKLEVIETPGHTPGEIVLLDSKNKQVFTGDNDNIMVWLFLPASSPLEVYLQSLRMLGKRTNEFKTIYPGHGSPLPGSFIGEQIRCVESILDGTCKGEEFKSFAGSSLLCKYKTAMVAFDPNNLHPKQQH
jgi:hydroxyacylglutathione hydrolase